jgi:hypothetical protein
MERRWDKEGMVQWLEEGCRCLVVRNAVGELEYIGVKLFCSSGHARMGKNGGANGDA